MKKMRTYSRRGRALRSLALFVVLLIGCMALRIGIGSYCVTPEQAMRRMEYQNGLSGLNIIHTEQSEENPEGEYEILLCHGGEYLAFNMVEHSLASGWGSRNFQTLDMNDPERRNLVYMCEDIGNREAWFCLVGFVPEGEEAPTFRVGIYNPDNQKEDGSDRLSDTVTYTPTPTIRVDGGMIFLEQHTYSAPETAEPTEEWGIDISHDILYDGVWTQKYNWSETNINH